MASKNVYKRSSDELKILYTSVHSPQNAFQGKPWKTKQIK